MARGRVGGWRRQFDEHALLDLDDYRKCFSEEIDFTKEEFYKMIDEAHRRGVRSVRLASYRQACREGWAPAPTNDVQRAIFEQVKADKERGPTNPITIPPPNAAK